MVKSTEKIATEKIARRYRRLANVYDLWDLLPERLFYSRWRRILWSEVKGERLLEIGVGTGKNIAYYPRGANVTAIDLSPPMLQKARAKAERRGDVRIEFCPMDAEHLTFPDASFDAVVASFVFCLLPDPLRSLQEVRRVCTPGGEVHLLEFMHSGNPALARLQDLLTPLSRALYLSSLNRDILRLVEKSGLKVKRISEVTGGIAKIVRAAC